MPIYEFLCRRCNRIYSFLVPTMSDERAPTCPRCGAEDLDKQVSLFAFVRGGTDPLAAIPKDEDDEDEPTGDPADAPARDEGLYRLE